MFSYIENLLKPFPPELPTRPPATLFEFCWHYTRGVWPWIFFTSFLVTVLAILEVVLFGFLGNLIDWLTETDKEHFLEQEGDTLMQLMEGKTVIAIAHRLLTISAMDRLVVIDQGRIVEMGNHDQLSTSNGLYAELWKRQSGGFIE